MFLLGFGSNLSSSFGDRFVNIDLAVSHLESYKIAPISKPGQFINILPHENFSRVMRRPMSISYHDNQSIKIIKNGFIRVCKI